MGVWERGVADKGADVTDCFSTLCLIFPLSVSVRVTLKRRGEGGWGVVRRKVETKILP